MRGFSTQVVVVVVVMVVMVVVVMVVMVMVCGMKGGACLHLFFKVLTFTSRPDSLGAYI
jgi:hypothetical protein